MFALLDPNSIKILLFSWTSIDFIFIFLQKAREGNGEQAWL